MLLQEIIRQIESVAPLSLQESYDNAGLLTGDPRKEITAALVTLDVTEAVIAEALAHHCELIISHHPLIFKGIKRLTGSNEVERTVLAAIKNDLAIYAVHTNLDNVPNGVNGRICEKLQLQHCRILAPMGNQLSKLVTFVPEANADQVRNALFAAGAGVIGHYDQCSFNASGFGTFRGDEASDPYVGKPGILHQEAEVRLEVIVPRPLQGGVTRALLEAHPYEEVAYDFIALENVHPHLGAGMIGELPAPVEENLFLNRLKEIFDIPFLKHTRLSGQPFTKVAVCGGSGSFLLGRAIREGATLFLSADFKYHDYFEADGKIVVADIGHYESEQFTKEVLREIVLKKFPTFAVRLSEVKTNPVFYL
ncbi:MAG: Nif3-like dinuclear metal center hexameric protein [Marinilabiliales bacterium]|nr:Nif3-like dinuclear metal center hexameric protein [Marinilabiliales bacterium]